MKAQERVKSTVDATEVGHVQTVYTIETGTETGNPPSNITLEYIVLCNGSL